MPKAPQRKETQTGIVCQKMLRKNEMFPTVD